MSKHTLILLLALLLLLSGCEARYTKVVYTMTYPPVVTVVPVAPPGSEKVTVYVTEYGKKYHIDPGCSSIRDPDNLEAITLKRALTNKYTPCSRCAGEE